MNNEAKSFFCFLVFSFTCISNIFSQQTDSVLNMYADSFPQEKIHIHFDRSVYNSTETIYYKLYLLDDLGLSGKSKNIYVDWYNPSGELLKQTVAPVFLSGAKGSFEIPADYTAKTIRVKAYTRWMLNFDTAFIYNRTIAVRQRFDDKKRRNESSQKVSDSIHAQLYPEGGFAVAGLSNRFAFKAINQYGSPVYIKGKIKNNNGKLVDSFAAEHDGMGVFSLLDKQGEIYFFEWTDEQGKTGKVEILTQKESGACMHILPAYKKAVFTVERSANTKESFKMMHLLVHKNHSLRYKIDLNMSEKRSMSSEVSTDDLPTGIVQFTLFDANWVPVAERVIFVNNQNHTFFPKLNIVKKDLTKRGRNQLEIFVPDTLLANMSIAVTDAAIVNQEDPTIFSELLFTDEIRGKVNNPAYYFINEGTKASDKQDSTLAAHLDLVMLTNGHRQFDWDKITKGKLMDIQYPAETDYLQIEGKITGKNVGKSKDPLSMNVMLQTKDSSKSMYVIPIQKDGTFKQKNTFYYDTVHLFYSFNENKLRTRDVSFQNNLLNVNVKKSIFPEGRISKDILSDSSISYKSTPNPLFEEQDKLRESRASAILKEVIVTTRVKSKKQILDEFYTRGVFAGEGNNYTVDVEGDINSASLNIWNYLQSKIPGLTVTKSAKPEPDIRWFGDSPDLFLDELPTSLSALSAVNITSIAYVKAFRPPFVGAFSNAPNGAIALYSKKGYSPVYNNTTGDGLQSSFLSGYTKFKEFIQPDYENIKVAAEPDYRGIVYFNPFVLTDKNNPRVTIDFYDNDISKKLCVILEGVDASGKMARAVKILE